MTDPSWCGLDDGSQVYYRAPDFWRPGTTIAVRSGLEGLPIGGDRIGDADRIAASTIGRQVSLQVDNATKRMAVYRDGKLIRKTPVSPGKPSTPTPSGRMVIMEKLQKPPSTPGESPTAATSSTWKTPSGHTWGGEFIHGAPWSEGDQGKTNVSHGCTNVSAAAADWLMGITQVGDLVTFTGTEVRLQAGNGWTAWNLPWTDFVKGSALPVPPSAAAAPTAAARTGTAGGSPAPSTTPSSTMSARAN
ncbi:L,D-transpeptidase [Micromonospora aurantiaca (nom. illeg.)]|uniref:L,D-transpeptidase n=1 Tax=Micromonospora aurantiaca (nom. illeg.) TaxID=47850 RepID=UPI003DA22DCE